MWCRFYWRTAKSHLVYMQVTLDISLSLSQKCFGFKRHPLLLPPFSFSSPAPGFGSSFCSPALAGFGPGGSRSPVRRSRRLLVASSPLACLPRFPKTRRHLTPFFKAVSRPGAVPGAEQSSSLPPLPPPPQTRTPTHPPTKRARAGKWQGNKPLPLQPLLLQHLV